MLFKRFLRLCLSLREFIFRAEDNAPWVDKWHLSGRISRHIRLDLECSIPVFFLALTLLFRVCSENRGYLLWTSLTTPNSGWRSNYTLNTKASELFLGIQNELDVDPGHSLPRAGWWWIGRLPRSYRRGHSISTRVWATDVEYPAQNPQWNNNLKTHQEYISDVGILLAEESGIKHQKPNYE